MMIPHNNKKPLNLKIPSIGIIVSIFLWLTGTAYVFSVAINAFEYRRMKDMLGYYTEQFIQMEGTVNALRKAEGEFRKLFSLNSKEKVLENLDTSDLGSIDIEALKQEISKTVETVGDIKDYLSQQRDVYMATPKGWPVEGKGHITSHYGQRIHPKTGDQDFHGGIDVGADPGHPVISTADGIVSFSGWSGGGGNVVVIEHGFGFTTLYAHNKMNIARVGQRVKRGDVIAYVGSTGNATGPHVHYEIWKNGKSVNPKLYIQERS